jgi:hypothetical protein
MGLIGSHVKGRVQVTNSGKKQRITPWLALLTVLAMVGLSAAADGQTIVIQLFNGKTRKPLSGYRVYVLLGDPRSQHTLDLKTDRDGKAQFDSAGESTFQVRPVGTVACVDPKTATGAPDFHVPEVLAHGVVTRNDCSNFNPEPMRGQVTYLAHPGSWLELFRN